MSGWPSWSRRARPRGLRVVCGSSARSRALQLRCAEGVALLELAAFEAALEPAHALRRAAMGEALRHDIAAGAPLQPVVADRAGSIQSLLDIARLENVACPIGFMRPDARE